jgi:hypothetical protein
MIVKDITNNYNVFNPFDPIISTQNIRELFMSINFLENFADSQF